MTKGESAYVQFVELNAIALDRVQALWKQSLTDDIDDTSFVKEKFVEKAGVR
jgi:hypothetical protein